MNVETLLGWGRAIARAYHALRALFGGRGAADQRMAENPAGRQPAAPAAAPEPPRLGAIQLERQLRAEVQNPRYTPVADDPATAENERRTYCNYFTRACCAWYGWTGFESPDRDQAGEITRYMRTHPETWRRVGMVEAAALASRGHLVVAAQEEPKPPPTGHVCIVAPGDPVYSNKWGTNVPLCANVGGSNWYGKALSFAFGTRPPELFLYTGQKPAA